jgi:hypothetical protein
MRIGRRLTRTLTWGLVLLSSILGGGLWFAYWYMTDSDTASKLIREQAIRFFPKAIIDPGRVRIQPFSGQVVLHELRMRQQIDGVSFETMRIPFLNIRINRGKLAKGELEASEIVVGYPTLRLRRRHDGTWNLQGLLADPWPGPWIETPPILIRNATLELIPEEESAHASALHSPAALRAGSVKTTSGPSLTGSVAEAATAKGGSTVGPGPALLRDVTLKIEKAGTGPSQYKFEGSAHGDIFDRLTLNGTIDLSTGVTTLDGELAGLTLSDALRRRIPREVRPVIQALALNNGVLDLELHRFRYDPAAPSADRLRYKTSIRLREGVWDCPILPFTVNDLGAALTIEDGVLSINHAQGSNGTTTLRAEGVIGLTEPERFPLDLRIDLIDLELDKRLRKRTPLEYDELWDIFEPRGSVNASVHMARSKRGAPLDWAATVLCRDVSAVYREFRYPLEHLTGLLSLKKNTLEVDLKSLIAGRPVRVAGTIQNPGPNAVVQLDVQAESLPVDETLKKAVRADVRKVLDQFNPSGLVKVHAKVFRRPMTGAGARKEGLVEIDADVDLGDRCEITWERLPYPIRNLKGRLHIEPDRWTFQKMCGSNGRAIISASGSVEKLSDQKQPNGDYPLKIDINLQAQNLPFSGELKEALPKAWRKTWPTINPSGACDAQAEVHVDPRRTDHTHTHIEIFPRRESNLKLEITRSPQPGLDPGGTIELPMEDVRGRFIFDDGRVVMNDVTFNFRGAPVKFSRGAVKLEDTGRFDLNVHDLLVERIRFDLDLRKRMPPLMAQFALRLDDGHTFRARGDLQIGWSGVEGDLAWCKWSKTLVVFNDNTIKTAIPLEHIHGQIEQVSGSSNGRQLQVEGILNIGSVSLLGQQITRLESPFHVQDGVAKLDSIRGSFLKGELLGEESWITLDDTPRYHTALSIQGAQLEEYTRTISGRQSYRGTLNASIELNGLGSDVRSLRGGGEAHLLQGDLGELPALFRIAKFLNPLPKITLSPAERMRTPAKTAFDSADVIFTVSHGLTTFDPIKFTGNAFSLLGQGTLDPQGNLDLRLNVLWGRDRFHFPVISDVSREASTPFLICHVQGTPSSPRYEFVPLPLFNELIKLLGQSRSDRQSP